MITKAAACIVRISCIFIKYKHIYKLKAITLKYALGPYKKRLNDCTIIKQMFCFESFYKN